MVEQYPSPPTPGIAPEEEVIERLLPFEHIVDRAQIWHTPIKVHSLQPPPEELTQGILDPVLLPEKEVPLTIEPIPVVKKDNATLGAGPKTIKLAEREMLLFNILLVFDGHHAVESTHFYRLGFGHDIVPQQRLNPTPKMVLKGRSVYLSKNMRSLADKLRDLTGKDALIITGNKATTRYHLAEGFQLSPDFGSESDAQREEDIIAALKQFKHYPGVARRIAAVNKEVEEPEEKTKNATSQILDRRHQFPLLKKEEEQRLGRLIDAGLRAYRELAGGPPTPKQQEAILDLVYAVEHFYGANVGLLAAPARSYGKVLALEDAIMAGSRGLLRAVYRYDYRRGNKFSTVATTYIANEIMNEVANTSRTIRVPSSVHFKWTKLRRAEIHLMAALQRHPTNHEIANEAGLKPTEVDQLRQWGAYNIPSLDQPISAEETTLGNAIPSEERGIETVLDRSAAAAMIHRLLEHARLNEHETFCLGLHAGITSGPLAQVSIPTPEGSRLTVAEAQAQWLSSNPKADITQGLTMTAIARIMRIRVSSASAIKDQAYAKLIDAKQALSPNDD